MKLQAKVKAHMGVGKQDTITGHEQNPYIIPLSFQFVTKGQREADKTLSTLLFHAVDTAECSTKRCTYVSILTGLTQVI